MKKQSFCHKFKKNPLKYFTSPIKTKEIEGLDHVYKIGKKISNFKEKIPKTKDSSDRLCRSERGRQNEINNTFEIIQSLRYDNLPKKKNKSF